MKNILDHSGFIYQGYIEAGHLRRRKYLTQKQWEKFKVTNIKEINGVEYYLDVQEYLCKKFDIILTDYVTKRERRIRFLKKFNMKNVDKGIEIFNGGVQEFSKMMDEMFSQLGDSKINKSFITGTPSRKNSDFIIGKKKPVSKKFIQSRPRPVQIWPDKPKKQRVKRKGRKRLSRDEENLRRIWG